MKESKRFSLAVTVITVIVIFLSAVAPLPAETKVRQFSKQDLLQKVRLYRKKNEHKIIGKFIELLSIPNVSTDKKNIRKNASFIKKMMDDYGIKSQVLETDGNPVVYGELESPGASHTMLFYVHYDGQPVDPSQWTDSHPFKPVLRRGKLKTGDTVPKPSPLPPPNESFDKDWRLYARGSSDDKAPIICLLSAIDAVRQAGFSLKNNIKFIFEGEEEAGSPNLASFLEKNKELLKCDVLFMCDGPGYFNGAPTLFFGVRGLVMMEITVYGANTNLHSGHYGNWAPNPGMRLSQLLASMKDGNGNVLIEGYYDSVTPLSKIEQKALDSIPGYEKQLLDLYSLGAADFPEKNLMESLQSPSLNVVGMRCGWVGKEARTIIPSYAVAALDLRLVKDNHMDVMVNKVISHIQKQGYVVVKKEPTAEERRKHPRLAYVHVMDKGYKASRTSMDLPAARRVLDALSGYYDTDTVCIPSLGGSLPIYIFEELLGVPIIGVPIANYDNNQHQADENIRIGNLWKGIETFAGIIMAN
ncbi:MAG: M20/M25/M40 family metallo-hydrolase [bacterium]|nr:M20/M25/M40 family metallo-hydrolase [bacterium]